MKNPPHPGFSPRNACLELSFLSVTKGAKALGIARYTLAPVLNGHAGISLDGAGRPADLSLPGYRLHQLRGDLKGYWSVTTSGNWRVFFRFETGDAFDVDLVDYH